MTGIVEKVGFPPSPPFSDKADSDASSLLSDGEIGFMPFPPQSIEPKDILLVDLNSPDKHVPRDPRLIRLTGNHPFNCEAPLTTLFEAGIDSVDVSDLRIPNAS